MPSPANAEPARKINRPSPFGEGSAYPSDATDERSRLVSRRANWRGATDRDRRFPFVCRGMDRNERNASENRRTADERKAEIEGGIELTNWF